MPSPASQRRLVAERVAREDIVTFVNACFACTGQAEFYGLPGQQAVAIDFLHEYVLGNYRRLYARTLAAGINHYNRAAILVNLLAAGAGELGPAERREEGLLIQASLRDLPPQRALRVARALAERRVNNRRARAAIRDWLAWRPDRAFDAVKYRSLVRGAVAHAHLRAPGELGAFLFAPKRAKAFETPLFERWRAARYDKGAIFDLPFTVAEGIAASRGVSTERLLAEGQATMTAGERLRAQDRAAREGVELAFDLGAAPLTKLASYVLSFPVTERAPRRAELDDALRRAARRALRRSPASLGRVAAVLDRSRSAAGSTEKRRRPLAVALGAHYLIEACAREYRAFWTVPVDDPVLVTPYGQTDLATPLLDALEWGADVVIVVSDGFENDPAGGAGEVARCFRERIDPARRTSIVHMNPVFDSERYAPRSLGAAVPTVGLRDAEDLPTVLGFARFADGAAPLADLERFLEARMADLFARRLGLAEAP